MSVPVYVTVDSIKQRLVPLLKDRVTLMEDGTTMFVEIAEGRHMLLESQDARNGEKNPFWLNWRLKCVWTGSLPSGATFYKWSHPVVTWLLQQYTAKQYPFHTSLNDARLSYDWPTELQQDSVLFSALQNFKYVGKDFTEASKYFMSVGSRLEDTAIEYYVKNYVPRGFAAEEFLRTVKYARGSEKMQGGSPDLMLLLLDEQGGFLKAVSGEVKCTANCQNTACKARRTSLAKAMRSLLPMPVFTNLYDSYCAAVEAEGHESALAANLDHTLRQNILQKCNSRKRRNFVTFELTDRITHVAKEAKELSQLPYVIYCTNDRHKIPHSEIKQYYVPQMQLEMFHQCTNEARMICYGMPTSGGAMNAFGMKFDMQCLACSAVYMQSERELAEYAAKHAEKFLPSKLSDENFPQADYLATLKKSPTYNRMYMRLHRHQEMMNRLSWRCCLGGNTKEKTSFFCPFNREWDELDPVSRSVLKQAWVEHSMSLFDRSGGKRKRQQKSDVYGTILKAWSPAKEQVRHLDFKRPDPKWLLPLTLGQLVEKYKDFCKEHAAKCGESRMLLYSPPPLSKVASLLAPVGFVTEPMRYSPEKTLSCIKVPTDAKKQPAPKDAKWQFRQEKAEWKEAKRKKEQAETTIWCFHDVFKHPVEGTRWTFSRRMFSRSKSLAPLWMGSFDGDELFMNEHGDEDMWLPTSPELIPSGTMVRYVVLKVSEYKGHHWAELSGVLVERDWDLPSQEEEDSQQEEQKQ